MTRPVRYCAFLPPGFDDDKTRHYPVLYFLHGLDDNEQSLLNFGGWDVVSELRRQGKVGDFVILAPSGGHSFYLNSENGKVRYEDFLIKEFMPQMEKKYRAEGTRATRGITGISMGGYGALRLAFKYPAQFAAVSAQMPALMPGLPKDMSSGRARLSRCAAGRCLRFTRVLRSQQCVLLRAYRHRGQPETYEDLFRCRQQ